MPDTQEELNKFWMARVREKGVSRKAAGWEKGRIYNRWIDGKMDE